MNTTKIQRLVLLKPKSISNQNVFSQVFKKNFNTILNIELLTDIFLCPCVNTAVSHQWYRNDSKFKCAKSYHIPKQLGTDNVFSIDSIIKQYSSYRKSSLGLALLNSEYL